MLKKIVSRALIGVLALVSMSVSAQDENVEKKLILQI